MAVTAMEDTLHPTVVDSVMDWVSKELLLTTPSYNCYKTHVYLNMTGFRSGDQSGNEAAGEIPSRRRRDENSAVEAAPEGRALPDGSADGANHDARFFGGMFGKNCFYDYHCPVSSTSFPSIPMILT